MDEPTNSDCDIDVKLRKQESVLGNLAKKIKTHDFTLTTHTIYIVANTMAIVTKFITTPIRR